MKKANTKSIANLAGQHQSQEQEGQMIQKHKKNMLASHFKSIIAKQGEQKQDFVRKAQMLRRRANKKKQSKSKRTNKALTPEEAEA